MSQPNILCFVTDQHRADHLGCYGNRQIRTPNIDRLAGEGVTFTQSYVANPVCMPNRATWFTGKYPSAHGLTENGYTLDPCAAVLPRTLSDNGYQTASIGKVHLAPFMMTRELAERECELYESQQYWNEGGELPDSYYGFDEVCLVDGHGPYILGDYKRWLDSEHPGAYAKLQKSGALVPPTGARDCWKASIPEELHYNTFIADRTIDFLRRRDTSRPFFTWCSFPDPHHPFSPPRPYCDMYSPEEIEFAPARREGELADLPDYFEESYRGRIGTGGLHGDPSRITDEDYREIHALTYGMISMVDAQVGRVVSALEEMSLLEDTIIVFMSDHADLMGDHWLINKGPYLFRGLVRVPTIWRMPKGLGGGRECSGLVSAVDFCPTVLNLAGVPASEGMQGKSYEGILSGAAEQTRDSVLIEYDESYISDRLRQLRTRDWAITAHLERHDGLLFDLKNDPDELHNLWDDPGAQGAKSGLLAELHRQIGDPGGWPPPKKVHA